MIPKRRFLRMLDMAETQQIMHPSNVLCVFWETWFGGLLGHVSGIILVPFLEEFWRSLGYLGVSRLLLWRLFVRLFSRPEPAAAPPRFHRRGWVWDWPAGHRRQEILEYWSLRCEGTVAKHLTRKCRLWEYRLKPSISALSKGGFIF